MQQGDTDDASLGLSAGAENAAVRRIASAERVAQNARFLDFSRSFMIIFGGIATGIAGVQGFLQGACCLVAIYLFTSLLFLARMRFRPDLYLLAPNAQKVSVRGFLLDGIGGQAASFLLFWTFAYSLVYMF